MPFEIYLCGALVALGYQLMDEEPRVYDAIVCPLLWPAVLVLQIILRLKKSGVTDAAL